MLYSLLGSMPRVLLIRILWVRLSNRILCERPMVCGLLIGMLSTMLSAIPLKILCAWLDIIGMFSVKPGTGMLSRLHSRRMFGVILISLRMLGRLLGCMFCVMLMRMLCTKINIGMFSGLLLGILGTML